MKKNFTFIFFLLGFIALVGSLPIKADDVNVNGPYIDTPTITQEQIDDLSNISLLLDYLKRGGTIDVSNTSSDYSDNDLLNDFGDFVRDVLNGRDTGIGFIDFINPFQSQIEYNGLHPIGLPNNNITNFLGILPFYALSQDNDDPTPTPTPPLNYQSYIDMINKRDDSITNSFWFYNAPLTGNDGSYTATFFHYPLTDYSIINWGNDGRYFTQSYQTPWLAFSNILDINIISNNNLYSYNINVNRIDNKCVYYDNDLGFYFSTVWLEKYNDYTYHGGTNSTNSKTFSYSDSSLEEVLKHICKNFKNVNIYVDGVPWSIIGGTVTNYSIDISTGTSIATNDYGYVHWVYDYEIYFDIDHIHSLLSEILNEIKNPSDPNNPRPSIIKWDDFQDIIYDVDGNKALGVKILTPDTNIDEEYISNYGPLVPVFVPLFTPVINDSDIVNIVSAPMDAIPSDLLDVFGYLFIGTLFVCFIHRLLE